MKIKAIPKFIQRNPVARSPLLKKGGVFSTDDPAYQHRRERQQIHQNLRKGKYEAD